MRVRESPDEGIPVLRYTVKGAWPPFLRAFTYKKCKPWNC